MLNPSPLDRAMTHPTGQTTARAAAILAGPPLDKAPAFTRRERAVLGLDGPGSPAVDALDVWVRRAHRARVAPKAADADQRGRVARTQWTPDPPGR
jgi:hypothetical protein